MHPAKSVILFTTASGAGYGLLVWLAIAAQLGWATPDRTFGLVAFSIAFALIIGGLLSSTLHLGHPERAWRALSQWRSSWLSREGIAAIVTFAPAGLFALSWVVFESLEVWAISLAWASAAMSMATVFTTSMIYASLKAIPAWRTGWTVAGYVVLSLATGAVLGAFLHAAFALPDRQSVLGFGFALLAVGLAVKLAYWAERRRAAATSTAESATGLGRFGRVRLIDAPHTEANYLLEEMGFQIARTHADKLRRIAVVAGFVLPAAFIGVALAWGGGALVLLALSAVSCGLGVAVERWLFFAEAKHVVTLYYGGEQV